MPDHIDLDAGGEFLGPACLRGDLYDVGGYPGIVEGAGLVTGLLYRLDNVALVPLLDEFEDVVPGDEVASLYLRMRRDVLDECGNETGQQAWVYWYNRPTNHCAPVSSGNWPLTGRQE